MVSKRSWSWVAGWSAAVAVVAMVIGHGVRLPPEGLIAFLFVGGVVAGALSTRQAWLSGIIVGLPVACQHLTGYSLVEWGTLGQALGQVDYWRLVIPSATAATGVAILGGLTGAWMWGDRFKPR